MRSGELIALKPRHSLEAALPTGERYVAKPYPKDNQARTFGVSPDGLDQVAAHIKLHDIGRDDLLFATAAGTPISRNTFRTRVWQPAVNASGVGFDVRMHDLRHAHASWLLAGGSDLASVMDRLGRAHIQTTEQYLHAPAEADQRNLAALDRIRGPRSERERSSSRIGPGVGLVRIETPSSSAPSVPNRHRARPRAGQ